MPQNPGGSPEFSYSYDYLDPLQSPSIDGSFFQGHRKRNPSVLRAPKPHITHYYHDELSSNTSFPLESNIIDEPSADMVPENFKQTLYIDDDLHVDIMGYRHVNFKLTIYYALCVLSLGIFYILCRWFPKLYIYSTCEPSTFQFATVIYANNSWNLVELVKIKRQYYGSSLTNIFAALTAYSRKSPPSEMNAISRDAIGGSLSHLVYFTYHCMTFIFNPFTGLFVENTAWKPSRNIAAGLTESQHLERQIFFGKNLIDIPEKSTLGILGDEILNPFYIFQIFSIILWCFENYYYYAACIFIITSISSIISLLQTRKSYLRLKDLTSFSCVVQVFRAGKWKKISSKDLVPGDIYAVEHSLNSIPADSILISGDCIINEGMLTGESVPVSKSPMDKSQLDLVDETREIDSKYYLFKGTQIVRVREFPDNGKNTTLASAVVVRTGFNTTKGNLIRSMLFPKPNSFKLYEDSFKFIGVLAIIAFFGFSWTFIRFIIQGVQWSFVIIRSLDLITIIVPPALPAAMSIGTSFSLKRLKNKGIFCISPPKINVCGKLNLTVFDKTGTLTEDGLDVHEIQAIDEALEFQKIVDKSAFIEFSRSQSDSEIPKMFEALATCHSLKVINDEAIGDPLDLKMFEFTDWEIEELNDAFNNAVTVIRPRQSIGVENSSLLPSLDTNISFGVISAPSTELKVTKIYEFTSSLRRMSVLMENSSDKRLKIYTKGAAETVQELCIPETLPSTFNEILQDYSRRGYRVIAVAGKVLEESSPEMAKILERSEAEKDLHFLGFLMFENRLKKQTKPVINVLNRAHVRSVMCTGDNILTAVSVARESSLVSQSNLIFSPVLYKSDNDSKPNVKWTCLEDSSLFLDPFTLVPSRPLKPPDPLDVDDYDQNDLLNINSKRENNGFFQWKFWSRKSPNQFERLPDVETQRVGAVQNYDIAITGEVFTYLLNNLSPEIIEKVLVMTKIYARMSPEQKNDLVEAFQTLGYCVAMVGDGANDCGALKSADVGISISQAEASIAAPFTSMDNNIGCVLDIIREGRAALVTSFNCFKYIALYSLIQFCTITILYNLQTTLGDFQFLFIDLFLILPMAIFMGRSEPAIKIFPKRPTASLLSKKVLVSLIGQIMIEIFFQIFIFLEIQTREWFVPRKQPSRLDDVLCFENTALFLFTIFQYISIALVFSVGPPYRKPMVQNSWYTTTALILTLLSIYFTLMPHEAVLKSLELKVIPLDYRLFILAIALCNYFVCWVAERRLFPLITRAISKYLYFNQSDGHNERILCMNKLKKSRKRFKIVRDELNLNK